MTSPPLPPPLTRARVYIIRCKAVNAGRGRVAEKFLKKSARKASAIRFFSYPYIRQMVAARSCMATMTYLTKNVLYLSKV